MAGVAEKSVLGWFIAFDLPLPDLVLKELPAAGQLVFLLLEDEAAGRELGFGALRHPGADGEAFLLEIIPQTFCLLYIVMVSKSHPLLTPTVS